MPSLGDVLLQNKAKNAGLSGALQKQIAGQSPYGMLADMLMRNGYQQKAIEYANAGSDYASQGADELRVGGNPLVGLPKIGLGALGWLTSPINAAVAPIAEPLMQPIASAVNDVFARPIESATGYPAELTTGLAMALLPGNKKGMKPRGLGELMKESTADMPEAVFNERFGSKDPQGIIAYHGSPHTFDKFDISRIGSGEGNQAFGHGLYFAEREGTARAYRDALSGNNTSRANYLLGGKVVDNAELGQRFEKAVDAVQEAQPMPGDNARQIARTIIDDLEHMDGAPARDYLKHYNSDPRYAKAFEAAAQSIGDLSYKRNPGSMYQVRLNVKPDELLDWDKPLSEQSETVRKIAAENGWAAPPRGYQGSGEPKGQNIYAWGTQKIGGKWDTAATTEKLKAAGIKGIRYKDAGSRTGEGGTYNYVIFDDSLIDILKRYGIPLAVGVGGAVTVNGKDMPPEVAAQLGPQT